MLVLFTAKCKRRLKPIQLLNNRKTIFFFQQVEGILSCTLSYREKNNPVNSLYLPQVSQRVQVLRDRNYFYSKTEVIPGSTRHAMSVQGTRWHIFSQKNPTKPCKLLLSELESTFREIWLWHLRALWDHKSSIVYITFVCHTCCCWLQSDLVRWAWIWESETSEILLSILFICYITLCKWLHLFNRSLICSCLFDTFKWFAGQLCKAWGWRLTALLVFIEPALRISYQSPLQGPRQFPRPAIQTTQPACKLDPPSLSYPVL